MGRESRRFRAVDGAPPSRRLLARAVSEDNCTPIFCSPFSEAFGPWKMNASATLGLGEPPGRRRCECMVTGETTALAVRRPGFSRWGVRLAEVGTESPGTGNLRNFGGDGRKTRPVRALGLRDGAAAGIVRKSVTVVRHAGVVCVRKFRRGNL